MGPWLSIENVPPIPDIFDFHRSTKDTLRLFQSAAQLQIEPFLRSQPLKRFLTDITMLLILQQVAPLARQLPSKYPFPPPSL